MIWPEYDMAWIWPWILPTNSHRATCTNILLIVCTLLLAVRILIMTASSKIWLTWLMSPSASPPSTSPPYATPPSANYMFSGMKTSSVCRCVGGTSSQCLQNKPDCSCLMYQSWAHWLLDGRNSWSLPRRSCIGINVGSLRSSSVLCNWLKRWFVQASCSFRLFDRVWGAIAFAQAAWLKCHRWYRHDTYMSYALGHRHTRCIFLSFILQLCSSWPIQVTHPYKWPTHTSDPPIQVTHKHTIMSLLVLHFAVCVESFFKNKIK